jgi:hypothetical protein
MSLAEVRTGSRLHRLGLADHQLLFGRLNRSYRDRKPALSEEVTVQI